MNKRVELHPEAEANYEESLLHYETQSVGAAVGFEAAVEQTIGRILSGEIACPATHGGCRYLRLKKYPFRIIFFETDEDIYIIAIAHHRRAPGFWHHRV